MSQVFDSNIYPNSWLLNFLQAILLTACVEIRCGQVDELGNGRITRMFMAKELYPSSYECDCGHQSHFSENGVRGMKSMSTKTKKEVLLGDGERDEHTIVFHHGEAVAIICSKQKRRIEMNPPVKAKRLSLGKRTIRRVDARRRPSRKAAPNRESFEQIYPNITRWVTTQGWIEMGQDENLDRFVVRALDEGGMVWEGSASYHTLDAALRALEAALAAWIREHFRK